MKSNCSLKQHTRSSNKNTDPIPFSRPTNPLQSPEMPGVIRNDCARPQHRLRVVQIAHVRMRDRQAPQKARQSLDVTRFLQRFAHIRHLRCGEIQRGQRKQRTRRQDRMLRGAAATSRSSSSRTGTAVAAAAGTGTGRTRRRFVSMMVRRRMMWMVCRMRMLGRCLLQMLMQISAAAAAAAAVVKVMLVRRMMRMRMTRNHMHGMTQRSGRWTDAIVEG